jgi:hypothetical protein
VDALRERDVLPAFGGMSESDERGGKRQEEDYGKPQKELRKMGGFEIDWLRRADATAWKLT